MNDSRRRVLVRVLRALAAAIVAQLVLQLPALGEALPRPELSVPVLTAVLLGVDKLLRERSA